ncbi:uncharacterized protein N7479_010349 [Penicillium vulpinum]|uniref:uncharacterized protein n=1 Tax=Penicillium vulpinum TaxID=29845 RepID=UPI0025489603|nr:uncharacterized protein N7479_010349 [Penicillium vulpinum]KAJ5951936.1 hypothetical protein N7479_010349 [Penicillium vulpinum]
MDQHHERKDTVGLEVGTGLKEYGDGVGFGTGAPVVAVIEPLFRPISWKSPIRGAKMNPYLS